MMVICRHWAWLVPLLLLTEVTPFPTEQTSGCQSANIHADNCYDVVSEPLAYNAARGQCILRGGRLAKISDSEVNSFLASICDVQVTPTVYIGLDDQETEGSFEWSDGTIADNYTNWAIDGTGGNQATSRDCVLYDIMTSTWSTRDCNKPAPYVCEYGDFELGNCVIQPSWFIIFGVFNS